MAELATDRLTEIVVAALEEVKAKEIKIFNTEKLTDQFERVVIASGSSNRQTRALAFSVSSSVKEAGGEVIGMEGEEAGEWVLVDCGSVVCHVLQPAVRDYYNLEEIWGGREVFLRASSEQPHLLPQRSRAAQ